MDPQYSTCPVEGQASWQAMKRYVILGIGSQHTRKQPAWTHERISPALVSCFDCIAPGCAFHWPVVDAGRAAGHAAYRANCVQPGPSGCARTGWGGMAGLAGLAGGVGWSGGHIDWERAVHVWRCNITWIGSPGNTGRAGRFTQHYPNAAAYPYSP